MVIAGSLNDLVRSLEVSVALGGQLIAASAAVMCVAAPLLAGWVSGFDRRRLLVAALLWYAIGHALAALMPSYATLLPVRTLSVLGAAVFTPQAAAAVAFMAPPEQRGRAITFIFLGWSVASVLGMPMAAWIGATLGLAQRIRGGGRARADRRRLGRAGDAGRGQAGGLVAGRLENRLRASGADGDGRGHCAGQRRPVRAAVVFCAVRRQGLAGEPRAIEWPVRAGSAGWE